MATERLGSGARLKRSDGLAFFIEQQSIHCLNFLSGETAGSTPILLSILTLLDRWRSMREIERLLPEYDPASVRRVMRQLLDWGLVLRKGTPEAERERHLSPWTAWREAMLFHFATKHAFKRVRPLDERKYSAALLRKSPQPPFFKRYARTPLIRLSDPLPSLRGEFPRVLTERRTHRRFGEGRIPIDQLSTLLRLTWSVTSQMRWPALGKVPLRTSPSGGARQPLEVYVWSFKVAGLARGLYHYRSDTHCLERLKRSASPKRLARLCARQKWIGNCAALFVMTAVFPRVMWRYKFSRAYRVVLLEAGHFCQTFLLTATWLGLAPFCTAALLDEEFERELAVDGVSESVLYAAGVGLRRPG
ncbi:MAG TPA: SagB/ThcOx family dehydrogenase [Methylomirabilota bacterium]|nr:SagB/ThcOx family dehydrogenase [Methylomirabilota bacterium]